MKGLICSIFEDKRLGNCSLNGISKNYNEVLLIGNDVDGIFEETETRPSVILEKRKINGREPEYLTVYPKEKYKNNKWYMFGGCFIYSSDGRFPSDYPIPLHDRTE